MLYDVNTECAIENSEHCDVISLREMNHHYNH